MTALVQKFIIKGSEKIRASKEADLFLSTYAGIVSHLLATLLLADEQEFRALASTRLRILIKRLHELEIMTASLPQNCSGSLQHAITELSEHMELLISSLHL